jgi:hypothetical protein
MSSEQRLLAGAGGHWWAGGTGGWWIPVDVAVAGWWHVARGTWHCGTGGGGWSGRGRVVCL